MEFARSKRLALAVCIIALLLHFLLFICLLLSQTNLKGLTSFLYPIDTRTATPHHQTPLHHQMNTPQAQPEKAAEIKSKNHEIAEMKPSQSDWGADVSFEEWQELVADSETSTTDNQTAETPTDAPEEKQDELDSYTPLTPPDSVNGESSNDPLTLPVHTKLEKQEAISQAHIEQTGTTHIKKKRRKKRRRTKSGARAGTKKSTHLTLADITRGYLSYTHAEGNDTIRMHGKTGAQAQAQQIMYARYFEKIVWAIQAASRSLDITLNIHERIDTQMLLCMNIHRDGKTSDLRIMASSGFPEIDRAIFKTFKAASSNFPPVPSYITENPLPYQCGVVIRLGGAGGKLRLILE